MLKPIRIDGSTGRVIHPDRTVRVTKQKSLGGPDTIRWHIVKGKSLAPFRVHFAHTPFDASTPPQDITVSAGSGTSATFTVAASVDTYKYSIYDKHNNKTDDPSIIIVP
jgi:hypothetical protein